MAPLGPRAMQNCGQSEDNPPLTRCRTGLLAEHLWLCQSLALTLKSTAAVQITSFSAESKPNRKSNRIPDLHLGGARCATENA